MVAGPTKRYEDFLPKLRSVSREWALCIGSADDFSLHEANDADEFARACDHASNEDLISAVLEIIGQGENAGAKIVFVDAHAPPRTYACSTTRQRGTNIGSMSVTSSSQRESSMWMPAIGSAMRRFSTIHSTWEWTPSRRAIQRAPGQYLRDMKSSTPR